MKALKIGQSSYFAKKIALEKILTIILKIREVSVKFTQQFIKREKNDRFFLL